MRRAAAGIALAALALGCGHPDKGGRVSEIRERAVASLRLPDADYAALDDKGLRAMQENFRKLFATEDDFDDEPVEPALAAIGAPRTVDLGSTSDLPVLVGLRYTGRRAWEVRLEQNAILVGVDLRTGAAYAGWPLLTDKRRPVPPPSGSGEPPDEDEAAAMTTGVKKIQLRRALEGSWTTGRFALTLVIYDWVSNTVVIDLVRSGETPRDAAPRAPSPALTRTKPGPGLPTQNGPGATLSTPSVDPGDPVLVAGAIDLPVAETVVVPSTAGGSLIAATLVMRKLDDNFAVQADVAIPAEIADGRARATFEVDARRAMTEDRLNGLYQVYLLTGTRAFGPWPMKVGVR